MLEPDGQDREHWTAPHNDRDLWLLQLADAFGTRSRAVVETFMRQLQALCGSDVWDEQAQQWRLDENEYSAALALVASMRPRDEMQAALAAQMVAVHLMQMKCSARAIRYGADTQTALVAGKLARTFAIQIEALQALQGKKRTARQSIKVTKETHHHQHMHWHRGEGKTDGEPQATDGGELRRARTRKPEECAALPSPDQINGEVLPFPGDAKRALPPARGEKSGGTKG